ncbi:MAG: hypothetical protein JW861_13115 [Bacteroidales bacterium]|nr:hypothetical protein [Bacteroidales bacterium]
MSYRPHILVCPLDWGIGHATRCVPVIRELIRSEVRVTVGADRLPLAFLKKEFPGLEFLRAPGYRFAYPSGSRMALQMLRYTPFIMAGIGREHRWLNRAIRRYGFDAVISDNRYGLWSRHVPSVFMTHQLHIRVPEWWKPLRPLVDQLNKTFINRYPECWVPDLEGPGNLSGELSHPAWPYHHVRYIGPLSRFNGMAPPDGPERCDVAVILSGPEPQRTLLEKRIMKQMSAGINGTAVIVRGLPGETSGLPVRHGIRIMNHIETAELGGLLLNAGLIICRPGYSTLMDLTALGRKALLVPTPGQTEQEYLADYFTEEKGFTKMLQESFDLSRACSFEEIREHKSITYDPFPLRQAVNDLIERCRQGPVQ